MSDRHSSDQLFRQAFLDRKNRRWFGDALLVSGIPSILILVSILLILALFLAFIFYFEFTRRINVSGEVLSMPQPVTLYSPQPAVILHSFYKSGQFVEKGSPLFKLDVSANNEQGRVALQATQSIERQMADLDAIIAKLKQDKVTQHQHLQQQLQSSQSNNERAIQKYVADKQGLIPMAKMVEDYDHYLKQGLVNREQLNNLRYVYFERRSVVEALHNQIQQQISQINALKAEISSKKTQFDTQILQHQIQYNSLQRQLSDSNANDILLIKAPHAGYIENVIVDTGQMVNPNDSLLQLTAHKALDFTVVLWLPNHSIPYINQGDAVKLRYHAFPYEKFGQFAGHIRDISRVPATANELSRYNSAPKNQDAAFYKVTIQPQNNQIQWQDQSIPLATGMKTDATLFLEQRPLYQWILSPFYDLGKSFGAKQHAKQHPKQPQ